MLWRLDSLSKVINYNKYCCESCNLAGFMNLYGFCWFGYSFGGHILVGYSVLVRRVDLCRSVLEIKKIIILDMDHLLEDSFFYGLSLTSRFMVQNQYHRIII